MRAVPYVLLAAVACAGKPAPQPPSHQASPTGDDLALLPVDADIVAGLDFASLRRSGVWKTYVAPRLAGAQHQSLEHFRALCGFDPLESISSIAIGIQARDTGKTTGRVVVHGFERAKSQACFDKDVGDLAKRGDKVEIVGDVVHITDHDGWHSGFTFVDDATVLYVSGPEATTIDGIRAAAHGAGGLRSSPAFAELYGAVDAKATLWFVMNGGAEMFRKMGQMPFALKALFGSTNIGDGLTLDVRVRTGSVDEAKSVVSMYKSQVDQMSIMVDKISLDAAGPDIKLAATIGPEKLRQLIQMLGGMLGGGMDGGGGGGPPPPPPPPPG